MNSNELKSEIVRNGFSIPRLADAIGMGKKAIILYTCGMRYKDYAKSIAKQLIEQKAEYLGSCYCRGFDTYGALEKIGGIAKKHPNDKDCNRIFLSLEKLTEKNS